MEPQSDRRNEIIAIIVICVVIIGGIGYLLSRPSSGTSSTTATSSAATSTSSTTAPIGITVNGTTSGAGYTIKPIYATGSAAPNYKAPLVISATDVPADERTSLQTQFAATQAAIAANSTDFNSWIALGDERKEAGDYTGAAADWQYMSAIYPTNVVSNANLADLYTNYLHSYPKAAAAYKAQIANDPTAVYIYVDLYQLYTNQYPQPTATIVALLKQGIAANPNAAELKADLAKYQ